MINVREPLERLRAVNPVPPGVGVLTPPDPVLFRRITSGEAVAARSRPSPWRARRLVPAFLVASLLGGTVAYAILRDGVTKPEAVACYERADVESPIEVAFVGKQGPIAACAELWRRGAFGPGVEVPPLVECVLDSGVAGVFPAVPGRDVCGALNLPPVTSAPTVSTTAPGPGATQSAGDVNARILAFRDAVTPQLFDAGCVEPRAAATIIRRELDRAGLGDWTVRGGEGLAGDGFSAERPCATLSLRPDSREVVLVPSPRR
jgi:hypothetical protein